MKKLLSKYYGILIGLVLGVGLAAFSYGDIMKLVAPTMIVDPTVEVNCGGIMMNPPVQITGMPIEQGKEVAVCTVPAEWEQYADYHGWGEWNLFNPNGILGNVIVWVLSIALGVLVIALVIYIIVLYRRGELDKIKKFIHK